MSCIKEHLPDLVQALRLIRQSDRDAACPPRRTTTSAAPSCYCSRITRATSAWVTAWQVARLMDFHQSLRNAAVELFVACWII